MREIARRELVSGVVVGAVLALAFLSFAYAVWGNGRVAAAIAIALLVSAAIATAIAMTLPYALASFGLDPAFGSGPIATVIQDLLSLAVYFAVADLLLRP
jgi:magnesium transporter